MYQPLRRWLPTVGPGLEARVLLVRISPAAAAGEIQNENPNPYVQDEDALE
jgi:hypothetical protein